MVHPRALLALKLGLLSTAGGLVVRGIARVDELSLVDVGADITAGLDSVMMASMEHPMFGMVYTAPALVLITAFVHRWVG